MTTTPPLRSITEPPTPLHGSRYNGLDAQPVRRSPRISKQRHTWTPSPGASHASPHSLSAATPRRRPRERTSLGSPPSSPLSPPRMQRSKHRSTTRGAKKLEAELIPTLPPTSLSMLPTPVKTPRKKDVKHVASTARVLFPHRPETVEEAMPRKKARKGLSLEAYTDGDGGSEINIFTDSRDKVPQVDESADNPFYTEGGSSSRGPKKGKPEHDHNQQVQDILERDEGMVYVFRGRKIYHKFKDEDYDEPEGGEATLDGLPIDDLDSPKRFTRSSVRPRFLFGKSARPAPAAAATDDEEAITDIDDGAAEGAEEADHTDVPAQTPTKPRFGGLPATPPQTNRTKRVAFHAAPADAEPIADPRFTVKKAAHKTTPFHGWARTKTGSADSGGSAGAATGKKRRSEELSQASGSKRGADELSQAEGPKRVKSRKTA